MKRLIVVLIGFALALQFCTKADAATLKEQAFVSKMNHVRSGKNLKLRSGLSKLARRHSRAMARKGVIFHTANLGSKVNGWCQLAENVGHGQSVRQLHRAFMHSPYHRANILGPYREVGVGVVRARGALWVTVIFRSPC